MAILSLTRLIHSSFEDLGYTIFEEKGICQNFFSHLDNPGQIFQTIRTKSLPRFFKLLGNPTERSVASFGKRSNSEIPVTHSYPDLPY